MATGYHVPNEIEDIVSIIKKTNPEKFFCMGHMQQVRLMEIVI